VAPQKYGMAGWGAIWPPVRTTVLNHIWYPSNMQADRIEGKRRERFYINFYVMCKKTLLFQTF
jgi:hypothetical protein